MVKTLSRITVRNAMARKDSIDHDVTASLSGTVCSLKSN